MFSKSKYNKSNQSSNNYKSNLGISLQSSKYHPSIYSKKKSTLNKKTNNNKFGQHTWKKQNSHNNWNKENDKNYLNYENYANNDTNKYHHTQKEKRENNYYYNKEYSYLSTYDSNEYFYKPKNFQKNEKKISIDYATTQSNSSSHEESNNYQYNSNDNKTNLTTPNNENNNTSSNNRNSHKLNLEQENNNINLVTDFTNLNLNSNSLNIDCLPFIPSQINNNNTSKQIEDISQNSTNSLNIINNIETPTSPPIPSIPTPTQQKKSKKLKKNKKFSLSPNDLDIKKSMSSNIEHDCQLKNEPYNKFNSFNSDLFSNIINPVVENTEILKVNVKIAKDKIVVFKLRRFDDLFLTVKLFCEINSIEEKLIKPIITKALCTLNIIYQIYNAQLDPQNIRVLKMVKAFENSSMDY